MSTVVSVEGQAEIVACRASPSARRVTSGVLLLPGSCLGAGEGFVRFGFGRDAFSEALGVLERHLAASA